VPSVHTFVESFRVSSVVVFRSGSCGLSGCVPAGDACVGEETVRAYPVAGDEQTGHVRNRDAGTTRQPSIFGCRKGADDRHSMQVPSLGDVVVVESAPPGVRFECGPLRLDVVCLVRQQVLDGVGDRSPGRR
jgi:hypothetical protein